MKNKSIFKCMALLIVAIIFTISCSKDKSNARINQLSPMENIMGKWYIHHESNPALDNPAFWSYGFSPTGYYLSNSPTSGVDSTTLTLTDTTFYYSVTKYRYTCVDDTLRFNDGLYNFQVCYRFHGL
jgi:hypothetical protein